MLGGLESLASKSLVKLDDEAGGEPRFRMLETIREFGLEQLEASGEEAVVRRRHLHWGTDFALRNEPRMHGPGMLAWMDQLTLEHDNLRTAMAWSLVDPEPASAEAGLWLASALSTFWFMRDHIVEGQQWIEQLLVANLVPDPDEPADPGPGAVVRFSTEPPPRPIVHAGTPRVAALLYLGMFTSALGNMVRSTAAREEALTRARQFRDGLGAAQALVDLGQDARSRGDLARALALGEQGTSLAREIGDTFGIWRTHGQFGDILLATGNVERAHALYEESLGAARQLRGPWQIAQSLRRLGLAVWRQGDLERATALLEEAVERWEAIDVRRGRHWAATGLGQISLQRGDLSRARYWFGESLTLSHAIDDRRSVSVGLEGAAATLAAGADGESMAMSVAIARLLGAAAALRTKIGQVVPPNEQELVEQAETAARTWLGDGAFEAARAEGSALSLDEAVDFAVVELARADDQS